MKGQTDVISIIIIAGIAVTLVSAAYMWSVPLLNKGETKSTFSTALEFANGLNQKVIDLSNSGGEDSINIPLGAVEVYPYDYLGDLNNSIIYSFTISQPLALNSSKTYLGGASFLDVSSEEGVFGESPPSIMSMEVSPLGTGYVAKIQIRFRKLVTTSAPVTSRQIGLNFGSSQVVRGTNKVTISFVDNIVVDSRTTVTKMSVTAV